MKAPCFPVSILKEFMMTNASGTGRSMTSVRRLVQEVNAELYSKFRAYGDYWLTFLEHEEFWNWGGRMPQLVEPLHRQLAAEKQWYNCLSSASLRLISGDVVRLVQSRKRLNQQLVVTLLEHNCSPSEVADASDWRDAAVVQINRRLDTVAWVAGLHQAQMTQLDTGDATEKVAEVAVNTLTYFRDAVLPEPSLF